VVIATLVEGSCLVYEFSPACAWHLGSFGVWPVQRVACRLGCGSALPPRRGWRRAAQQLQQSKQRFGIRLHLPARRRQPFAAAVVPAPTRHNPPTLASHPTQLPVSPCPPGPCSWPTWWLSSCSSRAWTPRWRSGLCSSWRSALPGGSQRCCTCTAGPGSREQGCWQGRDAGRVGMLAVEQR